MKKRIWAAVLCAVLSAAVFAGCGQGENYTVGVWGDSNPIYGQPDYTYEYMDEHFVQKLVGVTKAQIDAWGGYGSAVEGIDAVSGATVSTSDITSVLKSLFAYHAEHYYNKK